jgi:hypothetical protein
MWVSNVMVPGPDIGFGKEKAGGMNVNGTSHILIVDDEKELCALLSKFLSRQGYRVFGGSQRGCDDGHSGDRPH